MPRQKASLSETRISVREPESIFQIRRKIVNGTFHGRWHFSFGENFDPEHLQFGTLRVFNDDTLSPGSVWPLHPHHDIEVVTYCAGGEFRHADQRGKGGVLKKGWVQHTTVGRGMWHSEINNSPDMPLRFIQMWFIPSEKDLAPFVEQKAVEKKERTNRLLPLVSNEHQDALPIRSDARVYSCFLKKGHRVRHSLKEGRGAYVYVLEGDAVEVNGSRILVYGAAQATGAMDLLISADGDSELLLIDVLKEK
ncbi:MAG: pirin family protein [Nitrospirota bacterium]|nr:pirin family protein [Nitrospirota bacterium]